MTCCFLLHIMFLILSGDYVVFVCLVVRILGLRRVLAEAILFCF